MSQTSRSGRRGTQRRNQQEREEQVIARKRKRRNLVFSLLVLGTALALLIMVTPKEVQKHAYYSTGSEDGLVEASKASTGYEGLRISELMSSNHTAVPDDHGAYSDWIEIWNSSDREINMEGVGLSDDGNAIRFLFPKMSLKPDGRVIVFCDKTNQIEAGRALHAKFKLSSVGESVYLFDPNAYLLDSVTYRIMGSDASWALMEDGTYDEGKGYRVEPERIRKPR